jgi:molybdate transport system regulatory protein
MARLKLKIQLICGDEIAMGPGKADLLEAIGKSGSISAAARDLGMSYRRAWQLVDVMNRCFRERLVDTQPGGGKSAGARVTADGRAVLSAYRALSHHAEESADDANLAQIESALRVKPLPPLA